MSEKRNGLIDTWVQKITEQDMPVFSATIAQISQVMNNNNASATDVADIILRDASLTGRLLKMANSVHYNPSRRKVDTISRAVMVMGFEQVHSLVLSLLLIDSLSSVTNREKMTEEMAQSFHAAVQAQELAKHLHHKTTEDVFIATLLSRIGHLAFWAFSAEQGKQLQQLQSSNSLSDEDAEFKVLGFHLCELSLELCKKWALGELLTSFLAKQDQNDENIVLINVGLKLAQQAKHGWQQDEATPLIKSVSAQLKLPFNTLYDIVQHNTETSELLFDAML